MDPSPSGDAAGEGGVCDVAIDNKVVEDVAMDTGGDSNSGYKDESELLNGNRDESDIATDMKNSEADIEEEDRFAGFAPLTALNNDNDKDNEIGNDDDDAMEDDSNDAQVEDTNANNEAGEIDSVEDDVDEQVPDAMAGDGDEAIDSRVEADGDEEIIGHDVTAASFVTAGDQTLPDNTEGEMDETVENVDDERSQDESEEGLFHDAESSINNATEEADHDEDQKIENPTEETTEGLEPSNDVDELSRDSMGGSGLEPEQDSQDSLAVSEEPALEPEQDSQDSIAVSEEPTPEPEQDSQDSIAVSEEPALEPEQDSQDSIAVSEEPALEPEQDSQDSIAVSEEPALEPEQDSQDSISVSGEPALEPEQDSQDSIAVSGEPDLEQDSQDGIAVSREPEQDDNSQDSLIKEIQPEDSADNFDKNIDNTAALQQEDTEKNSEDKHVPEIEPISPEVEDIDNENEEKLEGASDTQDSAGKLADIVDLEEVSSSPKGIIEDVDNENEAVLAGTSDTQDSAGREADVVDLDGDNEAGLGDAKDTQGSADKDPDIVDLDEEVSSSPKGFDENVIDADDARDSANESTDLTKDDSQDNTEPKEMESMQSLYDNVEDISQDSKENQDSHESEKVEEQIEKSDGVDETQEPVNTQKDSVTEEPAAKDDNLFEADNNDNTSAPIITGVMSLEGIDFDNSNDGINEQMEVDDAGEKNNQTETQSGAEPKTSETIAETTKDGKDAVEEIGEEKIAESQNENKEMTEADEEKLLEETEEEKKADGDEAMETEDQGSEPQQKDTDKEAIPEKSAEDVEKSVEDTDMSVDQSEESAEKPREEPPTGTEAAEKTTEETQKSADDLEPSAVETEKSADDNQKAGENAYNSTTDKEKSTEEVEPVDKDAMKSDDVETKKVKQEKLEEEGEKIEGGGEVEEASEGPKIVGVTSAVGVADVKPAPVKRKRSSSEKKKGGSRTASPVVIDDDDDKTDSKVAKKEEKAARTTRSATVKKDQDDKPKPIKKEAADKDDDVIAIKEEKKPAPTKPKSSSKIQKCIVCLKTGKCKYNIVRNGDVKHLCDDVCFKKFRSNPTEYLRTVPAVKADSKANAAPTPAPNQKVTQKQAPGAPPPVYKTCSVCQLMNVRTSKPFLNWQGLDFCGEECLGKFQGSLSATCSYCASQISQVNRAKFCWRVGTEVKQFCSSPCYNEFIKRLKLCAFCNKDLANMRDSFMAPVGNQGTFKDFCSQGCLAKYEERNAKDIQIVGVEKGQKTSVPPKGNFQCQVCGKTGPVKHEIKLDGKQNRLCSDPCLSAFQYANKLTMNTCDNCATNCYNENSSPQYIQFEGQQKRFCSFMCVNSFKNFNKKTVPCAWCGAKKSNFDMIERVDANNKYQLFCSLNCLSLYRVNLQATSNQAVTCDQCRKYVPAQYHLTMSDASVRNFCSYTCVMQFQQQFTAPKQPQQQTTNQARQQQQATPQPGQAGLTTRSKAVYNTRGTGQQQKQTTPPPTKQSARQMALAQKKQANNNASIPIISNVVPLAPQGDRQQINVKSSTPVVVQGQPDGIKTTTTTSTGGQTVQQQIIIQPPPPKTVKNKSLLCKPYVQTKATSCKPHTQTKEVQTEGKAEPDRYFIPVPIPIYVPTPLAMYSTPTPVMVPVPIPVPVPVFIPTTKKSSGSILKQIKEIREKIPNDPLEAELLMMAEALGGKDDESSSESEDELPAALPPLPSTKQEEAPPQELGEDMLQMALRMASEMTDEPVMDLENSLEPVAVSAVPPTPPAPKPRPASPQVKEEEYDTDEYVPPSSRTRRSGGRKRQSSSRRGRAKRPKIEPAPEIIPPREATPSPQPQAPPPDANFHLKYTYGVNAWKHWVIAKNSQMEGASKSKKLKLFKTDILQCTADELNYALCLFVKEVRKPNGEEYAVDSIYYLCLGIQQYLFENGRIDNIFTDNYFDKFTEYLNEVLTMYEPKLNTAGQLVCRIEEEHLWESKQLGAHSPHVLLNSLVYFNTKYFMLKTSEDHLKLSFTHIMKHWKKTASGKGSGTGANLGRSVYLRYYCPNLQGKSDPNQKKRKEEMPVYEQTENLDNPLRCPVKLYEFYLSKCPESIKNRNDTFYLVPERSCVPDSPVWYSTMTLGIDHMAKMLNRIRLVREIQEAHLHTQPVYI